MIMKMENEMKYVAPEVMTLEVEVELGFAVSGPSFGDDGTGGVDLPE
ncbi:MAG: hypothetical protein LUF04_01060 [Bacteroides sp.]|nr:hypothetical protein [Bacteroides sp.]